LVADFSEEVGERVGVAAVGFLTGSVVAVGSAVVAGLAVAGSEAAGLAAVGSEAAGLEAAGLAAAGLAVEDWAVAGLAVEDWAVAGLAAVGLAVEDWAAQEGEGWGAVETEEDVEGSAVQVGKEGWVAESCNLHLSNHPCTCNSSTCILQCLGWTHQSCNLLHLCEQVEV